MKLQQFKDAVLNTVNKLHSENGEEFLEIMVDTIVLRDQKNNEIRILYGLEYHLSRSRHWDKDEKNYILHDGFTDQHLQDLYEDIMDMVPPVAALTINIDGMNDLDEPISEQFDLEL
jgi:hypothetical protein